MVRGKHITGRKMGGALYGSTPDQWDEWLGFHPSPGFVLSPHRAWLRDVRFDAGSVVCVGRSGTLPFPRKAWRPPPYRQNSLRFYALSGEESFGETGTDASSPPRVVRSASSAWIVREALGVIARDSRFTWRIMPIHQMHPPINKAVSVRRKLTETSSDTLPIASFNCDWMRDTAFAPSDPCCLCSIGARGILPKQILRSSKVFWCREEWLKNSVLPLESTISAHASRCNCR